MPVLPPVLGPNIASPLEYGTVRVNDMVDTIDDAYQPENMHRLMTVLLLVFK